MNSARWGTVVLIAVAASTAFGVISSASSSAATQGTTETTLLSERDADRLWVSKYNSILAEFPPGTRAATAAPKFFHPSEPGIHLFQAGLVDRLMVQNLRCAWITEGVAAKRRGDKATIQRAEMTLGSKSQMEMRDSNGTTFREYITQGSQAMGTDVWTFEFKSECSDKEGVKW